MTSGMVTRQRAATERAISDPDLEYAVSHARRLLLGEPTEMRERLSDRVVDALRRVDLLRRRSSRPYDVVGDIVDGTNARAAITALIVVGLLSVGELKLEPSVTDVECPTCQAAPGQRCRYTRGRNKGGVSKPHPDRRRAAAAKESA